MKNERASVLGENAFFVGEKGKGTMMIDVGRKTGPWVMREANKARGGNGVTPLARLMSAGRGDLADCELMEAPLETGERMRKSRRSRSLVEEPHGANVLDL